MKQEADIHSFVDYLIQTNDLVKRALYTSTSLFDTLVGTIKTEEKITKEDGYLANYLAEGDQGARNCTAYTEAKVGNSSKVLKYITSKSRYDQIISTRVQDVRPAVVFCVAQDPRKVRQAEERVNQLQGRHAEVAEGTSGCIWNVLMIMAQAIASMLVICSSCRFSPNCRP